MYLSGFSSNKIAELYKVDKASILKILKSLGVKIRSNKLNINHQEFLELKELAKRYDCSSSGLKEFLIKKGVDLRVKYNILNDKESQNNLINDYLDGNLKLAEIQKKYHCSYSIFTKILSLHGIDKKGKGTHFKLNEAKCLEAIKMFNDGKSIKQIAERFEVNKSTIYSLFKRYHVNYLTV